MKMPLLNTGVYRFRGNIRNDKKAVAECYGNIGLCLYKMDKYAEAINYFNDAIELQQELGDQERGWPLR
ncbi:MAG: tetratricopeptide repeat protein [Marinilabiliales bacterium]|nr:tetratricopeptide repeat protein [Marinilabiliales bacterium]